MKRPDTAWCVRCESMQPIQNPRRITFKNGAPAIRGTCLECGMTIYRIVKKDAR